MTDAHKLRTCDYIQLVQLERHEFVKHSTNKLTNFTEFKAFFYRFRLPLTKPKMHNTDSNVVQTSPVRFSSEIIAESIDFSTLQTLPFTTRGCVKYILIL